MKNKLTANRRGVTLIFVVSMIVLFLLMGTTFLVVTNDFLRSSRQHSFKTLKTIELPGENRGERFLNQAIYDLVRGPDLNNVNSPLRGHSILADMYGYGFTSFVKNVDDRLIQTPGTSATNEADPQFIRVELIGPDFNINDQTITLDNFDDFVVGHDMLSGKPIYSAVPSGVESSIDQNQLRPYDEIPPTPGRLNGQVLTFVSGAVRGLATRIVDHQVFTTADTRFDSGVRHEHRFVLMLLNPDAKIEPGAVADNIVEFDELNAANPQAFPTRVVINGRAFAGTGAGTFDPRSGLGGAALSRAANSPNQIGRSRTELYEYEDPTTGVTDGYLARWSVPPNRSRRIHAPNPYSTNENYDAVDQQNMFLAGVDGNGNHVASFNFRGGIDAGFRPTFLPGSGAGSFRSSCSSGFPNVSMDDGSGGLIPVPAGMRAVDVDNDLDGDNDGIWMDIGLPIYTNEDGQRIKPLVSYYVVDLDSKININAHGNRSEIVSNNNFAMGASLQPADYLSPLNMERGAGMGPAEIRLGSHLDENGMVVEGAFPDFEFERLMVGELDDSTSRNTVVVPGRYGSSENDIRRRNGGGPVAGQGFVSTANPGQEPFSAYKLSGYPNFGPGAVLGNRFQSTPMDIYGRFSIGFAANTIVNTVPVSMPIIDVRNSFLTNYSEVVNNPYEANLNQSSIYDQPFTLEELAQIYRPSGLDFVGTSPNRLARLAPSLTNPDNRLLATTDSWEVPTAVQEFVGNLDGGQFETLVGKLHYILSQPSDLRPNYGLGPLPSPGDASGLINRQREILANISGFVQELDGSGEPVENRTFVLDSGNHPTNPTADFRGMLSADVRSGLPFNVNQPFGNGQDDAPANGVVDEFGENDPLQHPEGRKRFDHDNNGVLTGNGLYARQLFARQLYVLTLLATEFVDRDGNGSIFDDFDSFDGQTGYDARLRYRRVIAQWAINVADFRDPDSIMSPFEVDLNPFDGWDVDGDISMSEADDGFVPANEYAVLWGTERPELLFTETIALHNRKTQDTQDDPSGEDMSGMDMNPDSRMVPVASAFFELYNPWLAAENANPTVPYPNQLAPLELAQQDEGVDLTRRDSNDNPVWRMVVLRNSDIHGVMFDPEVDPDHDSTPITMHQHRYIYFNTPQAQALNDEGVMQNLVYFPASTGTQFVRPGGYAIVGSAGINSGSTYTTFLGRTIDGHVNDDDPIVAPTAAELELNMTRRIELDQTGMGSVSVFDSDNSAISSSGPTGILPIHGPFDAPTTDRRSLGLSDPIAGYVGVRPGTDPLEPALEIEDGPDGPYFVVPGTSDRATANIPADLQVNQLLAPVLRTDGLRNAAYVVLLQRLADPTREFNVNTNPYRTSDSTSVDLFVFNGLENDSEVDPTEPPEEHFATYERRSNLTDPEDFGQGENRHRMLWKTEYTGLQPTGPSPMASGTHVFDMDLVHSFGRLNQSYIDAGSTAGGPTDRPFSWLTWNNRPFASPFELTLVPYTSSFHLTNRYDISQLTGSVGHYKSMANAMTRSTNYSGEFPHLLNFHADENADDGTVAPLLHRIFDYVEVPSRFLGTETYLNPDKFTSAATSINGVRSHLSRSFAPPYDYVSNFRNPGKVNINTISDYRVWNAIMGRYATAVNDQNGDGQRDEQYNAWRMNRINNPFRSSTAINQVPMGASVRNSADAGLFRRFSGRPAFDFSPAIADDPLRHTFRSAYFRYHQRNRLGNLVTGRSSVFAIWITVGYFRTEQQSAMNDAGEEVSIDVIGREDFDEFDRTTRNRAFFIVDRSIPVAFEPGKNHNVERAIRVSSYIE